MARIYTESGRDKMREIKFRYWDTDGQMSKPFTLQETTGNEKWDKLIPMQYTGIKDKHGREIYEGDIVRRVLHHLQNIIRGKVVFEIVDLGDDVPQITSCFAVKYSDGSGHGDIGWGEWEVIGNIYENPELLEALE